MTLLIYILKYQPIHPASLPPPIYPSSFTSPTNLSILLQLTNQSINFFGFLSLHLSKNSLYIFLQLFVFLSVYLFRHLVNHSSIISTPIIFYKSSTSNLLLVFNYSLSIYFPPAIVYQPPS